MLLLGAFVKEQTQPSHSGRYATNRQPWHDAMRYWTILHVLSVMRKLVPFLDFPVMKSSYEEHFLLCDVINLSCYLTTWRRTWCPCKFHSTFGTKSSENPVVGKIRWIYKRKKCKYCAGLSLCCAWVRVHTTASRCHGNYLRKMRLQSEYKERDRSYSGRSS